MKQKTVAASVRDAMRQTIIDRFYLHRDIYLLELLAWLESLGYWGSKRG